LTAQNAPFVLARILHISEKLFFPAGTPYISFMLESPNELQIARCVRNKSPTFIAHTILMLLADRYRRKAHTVAWYDSPDDEPRNLPFALKNPFGKRNPKGSTRSNNDQHLQETGVVDLKRLTPIRTDGQDYRSTTSLDRIREWGIDEQKQHSATTPNRATTPNVDSAHDVRNENFKIPRPHSPLNADYTADKVERVQEQRVNDPNSSETAVAHEFVGKSPLDKNHEGMYQRNRGTVAKIAAKFHKKSEYTEDEDRYGDSTSEDQVPLDVEKGSAKPTLSFKVLRMSLMQKKGDSQGVSEIRESNLDIADKHFELRVEGRRAVACLSLDVSQARVASFGRSPLSKLKVL
jgi:hypothetical protein